MGDTFGGGESEFHDSEQAKIRKQTDVKAFIPVANEHLEGLGIIN